MSTKAGELQCQGGVRFEGVVDGAGELSFEAADGVAAALSFSLFTLQVGARGRMHTRLGDRDSMKGAVELAVAAAVEPVALVLA